MECPKLDSIMDFYVESMKKEFIAQNPNALANDVLIDPFNSAKEQIKMDIIIEIVQLKEKEYKDRVHHEMKLELKKQQINQVKTFLIDGLILAFIVGIAVNQSTDIITWLKTQTTTVSQACIWVTILIVIISIGAVVAILNYRYLNKISDYLNNKD